MLGNQLAGYKMLWESIDTISYVETLSFNKWKNCS